MKLSDKIFTEAVDFQNRRKDITDAFENRMAELEKAKGSAFYDAESKKAKATRDSALDELKRTYSLSFNDVISSIAEINSKRGIAPPTTEALNLLNALRLRGERLTAAECDAAANTLADNPLALSLLTDLARERGFPRGYLHYNDSTEMPVGEVESALKRLSSGISDFLQYDTTRGARIAAKHSETYYGVSAVDRKPLTKRSLFFDKPGCYAELAQMSEDALKAFCAAVDR